MPKRISISLEDRACLGVLDCLEGSGTRDNFTKVVILAVALNGIALTGLVTQDLPPEQPNNSPTEQVEHE
jgi:hypothetical protein